MNRCELKDNLKEHIDGLKEEFVSSYSGSSGSAGSKLPSFANFKADMGEDSHLSLLSPHPFACLFCFQPFAHSIGYMLRTYCVAF
jgi:hypothetical protein